MAKIFNVNGLCRPQKHYMVDLGKRLEAIKKMVDDGEYFTINRARQYGKTTTLNALADYLRRDYPVISMDFQTMAALSFESEQAFVAAFAEELLDVVDSFPDEIEERLTAFVEGTARINSLQALFKVIKSWCQKLDVMPVLIIDEVDTATNNQVFIDFLAQLRAYYLKRPGTATFQSVILAGVYDVRNIKRKLRPDMETPPRLGSAAGRSRDYENASRCAAAEEHKTNSPWNIAAKFRVDMSFSADEISEMLKEYEVDYHTGMDREKISQLIYDYTSGYPVLVSGLCKLLDEEIARTEAFSDKSAAWTAEGVNEAVKIMLTEQNALFESLWDKLNQYPEMRQRIYDLLFCGEPIPFNIDDPVTNLLHMFGFVKNENGSMQIANRIFETRLYNYFLMTAEASRTEMFRLGSDDKNQFISEGHLDVEHLLEKFVEYFDDIYGDRDQRFVEEDGRRYFMLFLKPIINGTGNYYVEARTRNRKQTDLIIDYHGEQFVIELKVWRGNAYNERGEEQLAEYLEYFHLKKGYMLSFSFNKKKEIGVKRISLGDKVLIEAVV
ncbi:MAG: ATP-binding protein [Lachnospiraceae bacterium]|nr:ATP-binding protein [Lachnospiraceae bacterium]